MNDLKNFIRFYLGHILRDIGLKEFIRYLQIELTKVSISQFSTHVKAAWIRRSIVTDEYLPLCSDTDSTIVLDNKGVEKFIDRGFLKETLIFKDTQIVTEERFDDWLLTGGIRNRQVKNWKRLIDTHLLLSPPNNYQTEIIAFELTYEVFLLYRQLEEKMTQSQSNNSQMLLYSIQKLLKELYKVKAFWESKEESVLYSSRYLYVIDKDPIKAISGLNSFFQDLLDNLNPKLQNYPLENMVIKTDPLGKVMAFNINQKPVLIVDDQESYKRALVKSDSYFISYMALIKIIKGAGIQEQTLVNQLATDKSSYYYSFCRQRLTHDLVRAAIISPEDHQQLYYCFYNIHVFLTHFKVYSPSLWNMVSIEWKLNGRVHSSKRPLKRLVAGFLDQIQRIS